MTPLPPKEIAASRPLWNPEPETFAAISAVALASPTQSNNTRLHRVRLSDWLIGAFEILLQEGVLQPSEVDMFETVYVQGCKVRKTRKPEGLTFLAPDGSVMQLDDRVLEGSLQLGLRPDSKRWTAESVQNCLGYKEWHAKLKHSVDDLLGGMVHNSPRPNEAVVRASNLWVHPKYNIDQLAISAPGASQPIFAPSIFQKEDGHATTLALSIAHDENTTTDLAQMEDLRSYFNRAPPAEQKAILDDVEAHNSQASRIQQPPTALTSFASFGPQSESEAEDEDSLLGLIEKLENQKAKSNTKKRKAPTSLIIGRDSGSQPNLEDPLLLHDAGRHSIRDAARSKRQRKRDR